MTWAEGTGDPVSGTTRLAHEPANVSALTGPPAQITATTATFAGTAAGDPGVFAGSFDVTDPKGKVTTLLRRRRDPQRPGPEPGLHRPGHRAAPQHDPQRADQAGDRPRHHRGPAAGVHHRRLGRARGAGPAAQAHQGEHQPRRPRKLRTIRVRFSIGRKWKVRLVVHRGTKSGPVVASVFRKFHKGTNTAVLRFRGPSGAYTVTITPRAAGKKQTIIRKIRVS